MTGLFDFLKPYRYILLTGPHRSGTHIAARMIANDLGIDYYEEKDLNGANGIYDVDLRYFFEDKGPSVLRCPSLCHVVHTYADVPGLAVVMLRRPIEEILQSQERIRWGFAKLEMRHYPDYKPPVARAKYLYWYEVQAGILGDKAFSLDYHALAEHPMWVPKEERADFTIGQYQPDVPLGKRYQLTIDQFEQVRAY